MHVMKARTSTPASWIVVAGVLVLGCVRVERGPSPPTPRVSRVKQAPASEASPLEWCPPPTAGPVFCEPNGAPERYVVGLGKDHGWERADWVELTGAGDERIAYALVAEAHGTSVKVEPAVQRRPVALGGMRARKVPRDEALRLGKHFGRVLKVEGKRVRVDLGRADGLVVGDSFVVTGTQWDGQDLGRVRVVEVDEVFAWAVVDVQTASLHPGLGLRHVQTAVTGPGAEVTVVVADFDAKDPAEATRSSGRAFARKFAGELHTAASGAPGWTVRYDETVSVPSGVSKAVHEIVREAGLRARADLVVWGSLRCGRAGCAQLAAVRPERFGPAEGPAGPRERDRSGLQDAAEATALHGMLMFTAQRYGDARYHLARALGHGELRGDDVRRALVRLAYAAFVVGQVDQARAAAQALAQDEVAHWRESGEAELARIELRTGEVQSARARLADLAKSDDVEMQSYALHMLGMLEAQQGKPEEARRLLTQSLALKKAKRDEQGEAASLHQLAILEEQHGNIDEARHLHARSLALKRSNHDKKGEAASLHALAMLAAQQGKVDEARRLYAQSLELFRYVRDVEGEAASLCELAILDARQGRVDEAGRLCARSLELDRSINNKQGEAASLHQLAIVAAKQGRIDEARHLYTRSLALYRDVHDAEGEAASLHELAVLAAKQGKVAEARHLHARSLEIHQRSKNLHGVLVVRHSLATMELEAGNVPAAQREFEEILATARASQDALTVANTLVQLGSIDERNGDRAAARGRWTEARTLFTRLKMPAEVEQIEGRLAGL